MLSIQPGERKSLDLINVVAGRYTAKVSMRTGGVWISVPYLFDLFPPLELMSVTMEYCNSGDPTLISSGPDLTFKGYDEAVASQGKAEYKIFYKMTGTGAGDCGTKLLTKPLIFIDGFNPGDLRKISDENEKDGVTYKPIWDYMGFGLTQHIGDSLRLRGFDVIVLNFPNYQNPLDTSKNRDGGADYIERNAMVLTKLIQNVNDSLVNNGVLLANRKIAVVGPSMGGQISRYALAYMEQQHQLTGLSKWKHNVNVWLSFDSPHHGANIPIGLQQFLEFMSYRYNNLDAKEKHEMKIMSVAARQLLIHHMTGINRSSDFFTTYYNNLNTNGKPGSNGYPQDLRKVALASGTGDGRIIAPPGSPSIKVVAEAYHIMDAIDITINNIPEHNADFISMDAKAMQLRPSLPYFMLPLHGRFFPWDYSSMYDIPNVDQRHRYSKHGIPTINPWLRQELRIHRSEYTSKNTLNIGSVDVVQGGQNDALNEVIIELKEQLDGFGSAISSKVWSNTQGRSTFIPTISSLGFKNTNYNWKSRIDNRQLTCEDELYFDNYFIPKQNNDHVKLDAPSAKWALEEIVYGKAGCPNICALAINQSGGDQFLCALNPFTFNIDVSLSATDVDVLWEYPEGIIEHTVPSDINSRTIKWDGITTPVDKRIKVTITPKISGVQCGGSKILYKELVYGIPELDYAASAPSDPQFTVWLKPYSAMHYQYSWLPSGSSTWSGMTYNPYKEFNKIPLSEFPKTFKVRVYPVGCSTYSDELTGSYVGIGMGTDDGGGASRPAPSVLPLDLTLTPNPTTNSWELQLNAEWINKKITVSIHATDGKLIQTFQKNSTASITIPAAHLAAGVYFINVSDGTNTVTIKGIKQ